MFLFNLRSYLFKEVPYLTKEFKIKFVVRDCTLIPATKSFKTAQILTLKSACKHYLDMKICRCELNILVVHKLSQSIYMREMKTLKQVLAHVNENLETH